MIRKKGRIRSLLSSIVQEEIVFSALKKKIFIAGSKTVRTKIKEISHHREAVVNGNNADGNANDNNTNR